MGWSSRGKRAWFLFVSIPSLAYAGTLPPRVLEDALTDFILSDRLIEDRNLDGKADLWRRFAEDGSLTEIAFDSGFSSAKPDLTYVFEGNQKWVRRLEVFKSGPVRRIVTYRGALTAHGSRLRIETENRAGKLTVRELEPLQNGGFRVSTTSGGKTLSWQEGGDYSNLAFFETGATRCLGADPLARLASTEVAAITAEIAGGVIPAGDCAGGMTLSGNGDPVTFGSAASVRDMVRSVVNDGLACLRNLKAPDGTTPSQQANRLADELLANVFSDAGRRDRPASLVVHCSVPVEKQKTTYAVAAPVTQIDFPRLSLNPSTLNRSNHPQVVFHEMLHMTGTAGHPHVHNYQNPGAADLAQVCAACCFQGDTTVNATAAPVVPITTVAQLRQESCNTCAGHFTPLSRQQVAYARTELVQGNNASYKYANYELRKAVINEPGNREAWLLLAESSRLIRPSTIDRDFRALAGYRRAYALSTTDADRDAVRNSPQYLALQRKLAQLNDREGNTMLQARAYVDREQTTLDSSVRKAILDLEAERAKLRIVIQSCSDFSSGSTCSTQATAALSSYRAKNQAFGTANAAVTNTRERSPSYAVTQANAEVARHERLLTCMQSGGSADSCFNTAYGNPGRGSLEAQDWNNQP